MKILHIINSLNTAGAERLVTDMLPRMVELGYNVELLVLNPHRTPFYEQLERQGISIHTFRHIHGEYNPFVIFPLCRLLKGFDIVHVHLFPAQLWVALCKWVFRMRVQLVTTEHSTSNTRFNYKFTTWIDCWMYRRYKSIICISDAVKTAMDEHINKEVPTIVVVNGINLRNFTNAQPLARTELDLPKGNHVIMQVARFQKQKNQDCVIRALRLLPTDVYAVFVGEGERKVLCQQLSELTGVADRVRFLGERADIPNLWATADIGVMSSHWEGFGLAAVEGMAAGKPIVVSNVDGLAQVVDNEDVLFEENNEEQLACIVKRLLEDTSFRKQTIEKAIKRAHDFSIDTMVEEYV